MKKPAINPDKEFCKGFTIRMVYIRGTSPIQARKPSLNGGKDKPIIEPEIIAYSQLFLLNKPCINILSYLDKTGE